MVNGYGVYYRFGRCTVYMLLTTTKNRNQPTMNNGFYAYGISWVLIFIEYMDQNAKNETRKISWVLDY